MERMPALDLISHSPDQTRRLGTHLARFAEPGDLYLLSGSLGSGKTTLVQGIARGLKVGDYVQSPTFILAMEHAGLLPDGRPVRLYHIDLYRLEKPSELLTFGIEDYLADPQGIVVIEWPEHASTDLFDDHLLIRLEFIAETKRRLMFYPNGQRYQRLVDQVRQEVAGGRRRSTTASD
ncbi:tRNA (adenosine(37)-N6)-threonylcarbamoyltransferase complex ATPase subunit type 1 TsaE [Thermorudis peleae]|uniref:tRNA (adenosine(37)-N6)-threonylcarbamoyltransferase complex ATPase subunit type 1 TsaE n=1 Tax=Thermorudis peleae TaxID=1382356 RepID=UPI00068D07BF|nr:tRNA (adenosine(37)-N6)-threonylcarbamoyltransferase complex ATPase subunit type 1 TsaE [Thermorudis peleae]MBX6753504.1 tRNA (adenosine(37)-N6)-threonylcarbamoyltransferase complex ATPase subunit type 1 TsaE [Thermorudis peleae]